MINTLYQEKNGKFKAKKANLTVQAVIEGRGSKKLGHFTINISEYHHTPLIRQYFSLESCPDRSAKICLSVKAQALGEAMTGDTVSEASGAYEISMGTEGDYKGPLFLDQDLSYENEEKLAPKIIQSSHSKPAISKPPLSSPQQLFPKTEAEDLKDLKRTADLQAKLTVSEREILQLKSEKEDLQVQLGIATEKSTREKESTFNIIKTLDSDLQITKKSLDKAKKKIEKRDETLKRFKEINIDLLEDLKVTELSNNENVMDKERYKRDNIQLRESLRNCQEKLVKIQKQHDSAREENLILKTNLDHVSALKDNYKTDLENLRRTINQNSESADGKQGSFNSYKRNSDNYIKTLKLQLDSVTKEREDMISTKTEIILQSQRLEAEKLIIEDKYKEDLCKFKNQIQNLREENLELIQKIENEAVERKLADRRTIMDQGETDLKLRRLTQNFNSIKGQKEELENAVNEYEAKLHQRNREFEAGFVDIQYLKDQIESKDKEIKKLKAKFKDNELEMNDIYNLKETLEHENLVMREQLQKATETEFSDPATFLLQEQLHEFENRAVTQEYNFNREKAELREKIEILEKQLEIIEELKLKESKSNDDQVSKLLVQNRLLKQQLEETCINSEISEKAKANAKFKLLEEEYTQNLQILTLENNEIKAKMKKIEEEFKLADKKYLDAKMNFSNANFEKEALVQKYREAQEQLRDYSAQFTAMEVELYKVNERFGQTLNTNNDLELKILKLTQKLKLATDK